MEETQYTVEEFDSYVDLIQSRMDLVDKESVSTRLSLYGLGHQGSDGDNNTPKPGMFDIKGKLKWGAWNDLKGMDQNEAR
jgi:diazepam-binding inhibitor (GABA receptor modulating acyl-CoA-binding protein)